MDSKNKFTVRFILVLFLFVFFYLPSNAQKNSWWDLYLQDTMHINVFESNNNDFIRILGENIKKIKKCRFYELKKDDFVIHTLFKIEDGDSLLYLFSVQNKSDIFLKTFTSCKRQVGVMLYLNIPFVFQFYEKGSEISDFVIPGIIQMTDSNYILEKENGLTTILDRRDLIEVFYAKYKYSSRKFKLIDCKPCRPRRKPPWGY